MDENEINHISKTTDQTSEDNIPESLRIAKELGKPEPSQRKPFTNIFLAALCFTVAIISGIAIYNKPLSFADSEITTTVSDRGPIENFISVILGTPQLPYIYQSTKDFNVHATPASNSRVLATINEGESFVIHSSYSSEENPTKLLISSEGGLSGYASTTVVDDKTLTQLSEIDLFLTSYLTNQSEPIDIFDEKYSQLSFNEKLIKLKQWYPNGRYWNTQGFESENGEPQSLTVTTSTPCVHTANDYVFCSTYNGTLYSYFSYDENIQCLAFANLLSDFLFGIDAPVTEHTDLNNVKPGDSIRFVTLTHSAVVTEVTDEGFYLVEVNEDYENCQIQWDRFISKEEISQNNYKVFSRY